MGVSKSLQRKKTYEGGGTYPVRFTYDDEGRMTGMTTYRDESGSGDTTTWLYDPATGVLVQKLYGNFRVCPLFFQGHGRRYPAVGRGKDKRHETRHPLGLASCAPFAGAARKF